MDSLQRHTENAIMATLYAYFFAVHLEQNVFPPILAQEALLAVMFLARRPSTQTSRVPEDWVAAIVGTFAPLFIRPALMSPFAIGWYAQALGFAISLTALLSLNRSFGLVAANRGIKTTGVYAVVRHPMYVGHLICLSGYLAMFPSPMNLLILGVTAVALFARVEAEERLLQDDPAYAAYSKVVRWRMVRGIY